MLLRRGKELGSFNPRPAGSFLFEMKYDFDIATSSLSSWRSAIELTSVSQLRALPVAPYPFEIQNTTRSLVFVPGGTLPCLQDSGSCTLRPLSCWAPLLSTARMMFASLPKEVRPNYHFGFTSRPFRSAGEMRLRTSFWGPPCALPPYEGQTGLASRIPIWDLPSDF